MTSQSISGSARVIIAYYGATVIFLLLDYGLGVNIRVAFLDGYAGWRSLYYLFCFVCLGLVIWRPAWGVWIGTIESLITLCALILSTALRVVVVSDEMIEQGRGFVTFSEIANFLISGSIVYISYWRGMHALSTRAGIDNC
jgi:uncharacterized membrane protein